MTHSMTCSSRACVTRANNLDDSCFAHIARHPVRSSDVIEEKKQR